MQLEYGQFGESLGIQSNVDHVCGRPEVTCSRVTKDVLPVGG